MDTTTSPIIGGYKSARSLPISAGSDFPTDGKSSSHWRPIDSRTIIRKRTEEERIRRHLEGDAGAKFSCNKYMSIGTRIMCALTTNEAKDNLTAIIYEA